MASINVEEELFNKKAKIVENLQPTGDALMQHIQRAMLQSMYIHLNFFCHSLRFPALYISFLFRHFSYFFQ